MCAGWILLLRIFNYFEILFYFFIQQVGGGIPIHFLFEFLGAEILGRVDYI